MLTWQEWHPSSLPCQFVVAVPKKNPSNPLCYLLPMDSASGGVDGQQALLARLKLDLAQNTSAIKAAKQAARKLQREAATGGLRPAAWRAVLSVYIWSNFNFHIATALAQRLARKKQGGQVGFVLPAEVWQQRLHESVTETAIKESHLGREGHVEEGRDSSKAVYGGIWHRQVACKTECVPWRGTAGSWCVCSLHFAPGGRGLGNQSIGWSVPPCLGSEDFNCAGRSGDGDSSQHPWITPTRPPERPDQRAPKRFHFRFRPWRLMEKVLCFYGPNFRTGM